MSEIDMERLRKVLDGLTDDDVVLAFNEYGEITGSDVRALLARGERRAASEEEIKAALIRVLGPYAIVSDFVRDLWRACEACHAIGTASAASAGEARCEGCGEPVPLAEVDSVGGHARAQDDGHGNPEPVHCGPVTSDAPREGISEASLLAAALEWIAAEDGRLAAEQAYEHASDEGQGTAEQVARLMAANERWTAADRALRPLLASQPAPPPAPPHNETWRAGSRPPAPGASAIPSDERIRNEARDSYGGPPKGWKPPAPGAGEKP